MENIRRRGVAERNYSNQIIYQDFQPSYDWTHDKNCHLLLVDLPGFMKEEVKVEVDNLGKVMISGERRASENRYIRFKQVSTVPEDSDIDKISAKLDGKLLYIVVPKKTSETKREAKEEELCSPNETKENKELQNPNNEENQKKDAGVSDKHDFHGNDLHDDMKEESERNGSGKGMNGERTEEMNLSKDKERVEMKKCLEVLMGTAMENIGKKKVVFVSVVAALSFGLYLSHKFRSDGQ